MKYILPLLFIFVMLQSCSVLKVSQRTSTGYFNASKSAKTTFARPLALDTISTLLVVPNSPFTKGMATNINYFKEVITIAEFEKAIITENKQDEVGTLAGNIGMNNAYKKYKKFLFLNIEVHNASRKVQLRLTNPGTIEDLFKAETTYDTVWAGVYDMNTFNPLFNELIKYIEVNSSTYHK